MKVLAFIIATTLAQGPNIEEACTKYDGDRPTTCEVALADKLFDYHQALQGCAMEHASEQARNERLKELILEKPVPEKEKSFSLFGMPPWLTATVVGAAAATAGLLGYSLGKSL